MKRVILLAALLLIINAGQAEAAFLWDWQMTSANGVAVNATDTVYASGRLYNNSTAGETISLYSYSPYAYLAGTSQAYVTPAYEWQDISGNIWNLNHIIYPGEYYDFLFSHYTPAGGSVPDGAYEARHEINLRRYESNANLGDIARTYTWYVGEQPPDGSGVVPEPATMALFGMGGIAMALLKRKRTNV